MYARIINKLQFFLYRMGLNKGHLFRAGKKQSLQRKIEKDLQQHNLVRAISRLEGALQYHPLDASLNDQLANLYFTNNNLVKAGKYWYLKTEKGNNEHLAVQAFSKSLGNDPVLILKKLLNKQFYKLNQLNNHQIDILNNLLNQVKTTNQPLPKFLRSLDEHIQHRRNK